MSPAFAVVLRAMFSSPYISALDNTESVVCIYGYDHAHEADRETECRFALLRQFR